MSHLSTYHRFALIEACKVGFDIKTYATRFDLVLDTVECGSFGDNRHSAIYGSDEHLKEIQRLRAKLTDVYAKVIEHRANVLDVIARGGES